MKIERICDNKIKVLIDDAEAEKWNINIKSISQNTPEAQKMFLAVLQMAKEIDFYIDGAKLFVEALENEECFGIMITKVYSEEELKEAVENCPYKGTLHRAELTPTAVGGVKLRKYIYRFESFDSVCSAAGELEGKYFGKSVLYKLDSVYYLYLIPSKETVISDLELILSEFGVKQLHGQFVHGRLNEYGEIMIEDGAVSVLSEYFCKI